MIDEKGFRANVGIIIFNDHGQVLLAKRYNQDSWQFPQGGVDENETPLMAMYRELYEELGLKPQDVTLVQSIPFWLRYKLPQRYLRPNGPYCIGQKQKWFLLKLSADESKLNLFISPKPEFDAWQWSHYWSPIKQVIHFKQKVYKKALKYFRYPIKQAISHKQSTAS